MFNQRIDQCIFLSKSSARPGFAGAQGYDVPPRQVPGVVAFIGAADIPKGGANKILIGSGSALIFAEKQVDYVAQPLGVIVASTPSAAAKACKLVAVQYGHSAVRLGSNDTSLS